MPTHAEKQITVLLAEDHPITRAGIRNTLAQAGDITVAGEAQDGPEVKQKVAELHPRVLLLDLIMPDLTPAELEKWVRKNHPNTATLVLTAHDRDAYLAAMMDAALPGI